MASQDLVQTNGLGLPLAMKRLMAGLKLDDRGEHANFYRRHSFADRSDLARAIGPVSSA
jgi:hypothetical protein